MADSKSGIGGFRTQIGGFNKEDVIAYINELQESHARELERSRQETRSKSDAYEKALDEANAALRSQYAKLREGEEEQENLQALINEQYAVNRQLRDQVAAMTPTDAQREEQERLQQENASLQAELEQVRGELEALRQQWESSARDGEELERLQQENASLQAELEQEAAAAARLQKDLEEITRERETQSQLQQQTVRDARLHQQQLEEDTRRQAEELRILREEKSRYRLLLNDVGGFVADVRTMGRRYLDDAGKRCDSRLTALAEVVASLQDQLAAASTQLTEAREALREQSSLDTAQLDAMGDEMMRTASGLESSAPAEPAEEPVKPDTLPDTPAPLPEEPVAPPEEPAPADTPSAPDFF